MKFDLNESLEKKYFNESYRVGQNDDGAFWLVNDSVKDGSGYDPLAVYFNLTNAPQRPAKWEDFEFNDSYVLDNDGDDYPDYYPGDFANQNISDKVKKAFTDAYNNFEESDVLY